MKSIRLIFNTAILTLLFTNITVLAATYTLNKSQNVIGEIKTIRAHDQDTLVKIAYQFNLGYEELVSANPGVDPWLPGEGSNIILPLRFLLPKNREEGVHINLSEYRLYYFYGGNKVMTSPVSIGRGEWQTPVGNIIIEDKIINPSWYPPPSIRREHELNGDPLPKIVFPGPDNPLGRFALKLNLPGYFIHGTNKPYGIGMKVTHGCIRLRPNDITLLFNDIPRQTPVKIYYEPYKSALEGGKIYFEANAALAMSDEHRADALTQSMKETIKVAEQNNKLLNWDLITQIIQHEEGIPWEINLDATELGWSEATRATTATINLESAETRLPLF